MDSSAVKNDIGDPSSFSATTVNSGGKEYSENGIEHVGLTPQYNGLIPLHSLHYFSAPPWIYPRWNHMPFKHDNINSTPATMMAIEIPMTPSSSASSGTCSSNRSQTLEKKHSRDGSTQAEDTMKHNIWAPIHTDMNTPNHECRPFDCSTSFVNCGGLFCFWPQRKDATRMMATESEADNGVTPSFNLSDTCTKQQVHTHPAACQKASVSRYQIF